MCSSTPQTSELSSILLPQLHCGLSMKLFIRTEGISIREEMRVSFLGS